MRVSELSNRSASLLVPGTRQHAVGANKALECGEMGENRQDNENQIKEPSP